MYPEVQEISQRCTLCTGTSFYESAGFYFCTDCQTQNDNIRETVVDVRYDLDTRIKNSRIKKEKLRETDVIGWTSWELYNFALIGITDQLIELGATSDIKWTICQLWTWYLTKLEVAFTSTKKREVPKISQRYHKKDAEIIYGRINIKKKKKKRTQRSRASSVASELQSQGSSVSQLKRSKKRMAEAEYGRFLQSQAASRDDAASSADVSLSSVQSSLTRKSGISAKIRFNKSAKQEAKRIKEIRKKRSAEEKKCYRENFVRTVFKSGPEVITPLRLWALAYVALRIHNQNIFLSDMLRFAREGHLSYYNMHHLMPIDISISKNDINLLTQVLDIGHKALRRLSASVAQFVGVFKLPKPNLLVLIERYCHELQLPRGIQLYAERVFLAAPSVMKFDHESRHMPNYEARAMAYIIFVLKILFGLDGITEKEISRVIDKINRIASERNISKTKLFSFCKWQEYIECRKGILINSHFPTKIKYEPDAPGNSHLYMKFIEMQRAKRENKESEVTNPKTDLPPGLVQALSQCIGGLKQHPNFRDVEAFLPSFTPQRDYIKQLLNHHRYILPDLMKEEFCEAKVGYMTMPESLKVLAAQCGIKLDVIDSSLQFFEKIVPPFAPPSVLSVNKLSETVRLETPQSKESLKKNESLLDYTHRKRPCMMKVDMEILKHFNSVNNSADPSENSEPWKDLFAFDQVLPDGRLKIPDSSDSEDDDIPEKQCGNLDSETDSKTCLLNANFCKNYDIKLLDHEVLSFHEEQNLSASSSHVDSNDESCSEEQIKTKKGKKKNTKSNSPELIDVDDSSDELEKRFSSPDLGFDLHDSDISILEDDSNSKKKNIDIENLVTDDYDILFRPFKNYWLYHCTFYGINQKNFGLFEKELPSSFRWLLDECANIVEMSCDELYKEFCMIEAYHLHVLNPKKQKKDCKHRVYERNSKRSHQYICTNW